MRTNSSGAAFVAVLKRGGKNDAVVSVMLYCLLPGTTGFLIGQYWFPHTRLCHQVIVSILNSTTACVYLDPKWGVLGAHIGLLLGMGVATVSLLMTWLRAVLMK